MDSPDDDLARPEPGQWYQLPDGTSFMITAMDDDDDSIEIQYFDGAIEEWDAELWQRVEAVPVDEPEDISGPFDGPDYVELGADEEYAGHNRVFDSFEE
jgi:hypothetical protein